MATQAVDYPEDVFTNLAYLIDEDFLREAYHQTCKTSAPEIDGMTAQDYAEHLDENLRDLHERLRSGCYQAPPVERGWLDKEEGKKRPIGKPTFEDKIVQRAVALRLGAIDEQDFQDFSYGFRAGRNPHQALSELREQCLGKNIHWIIDADIRGFFESLDHALLREVMRHRVRMGAYCG
jgi:retron-type reverse transcriptase